MLARVIAGVYDAIRVSISGAVQACKRAGVSGLQLEPQSEHRPGNARGSAMQVGCVSLRCEALQAEVKYGGKW